VQKDGEDGERECGDLGGGERLAESKDCDEGGGQPTERVQQREEERA
jgi:hypothetical protein